jgi:hypothetical protein
MNALLCRPADVILNENIVQDTMTAAEDMYATAPIVAVKPTYQRSDEEELHTSFEEAISDRLIALHSRLDRISGPLGSIGYRQRDTDPILNNSLNDTAVTLALKYAADPTAQQELLHEHPMNSWQRFVTFIGLALVFMLLGFDLMGFVVLHMR